MISMFSLLLALSPYQCHNTQNVVRSVDNNTNLTMFLLINITTLHHHLFHPLNNNSTRRGLVEALSTSHPNLKNGLLQSFRKDKAKTPQTLTEEIIETMRVTVVVSM
eukprot:PhF_6_TR2192/c0_g1_i4/m.3631